MYIFFFSIIAIWNIRNHLIGFQVKYDIIDNEIKVHCSYRLIKVIIRKLSLFFTHNDNVLVFLSIIAIYLYKFNGNSKYTT